MGYLGGIRYINITHYNLVTIRYNKVLIIENKSQTVEKEELICKTLVIFLKKTAAFESLRLP